MHWNCELKTAINYRPKSLEQTLSSRNEEEFSSKPNRKAMLHMQCSVMRV